MDFFGDSGSSSNPPANSGGDQPFGGFDWGGSASTATPAVANSDPWGDTVDFDFGSGGNQANNQPGGIDPFSQGGFDFGGGNSNSTPSSTVPTINSSASPATSGLDLGDLGF